METQNLSKLINEKLERADDVVGRADSDEIKRRLKILRESVGSWKTGESGKEYVKEIRRS
jgi:hypothetical protein